MPSLHELQSRFCAAVFGANDEFDALLADCDPAQGRARAGLEAYRRSVEANLAVAVRATYPLIGRIVGEAFLAEAARRYVRQVPSRCGDLNAYGADFDRFLATYPPAAGLPYLPAVATLEWTIQQVHCAADAPPADLARLARLPAEAWSGVCFRLDPAHACLATPWPLVQIWKVNRPGYAGDFRIDFELAETVLVHRRGQGVAVEALSHGEHALLVALADGKTLGEALESLPGEAEIDLSRCLARFLSAGLLRGASLPEGGARS